MIHLKNLILITIYISIGNHYVNSQRLFQQFFENMNVFFFNDSIPDRQNFLPEYDFIIIGGGSGGSVMANRLSEISHWKILLLEAGGEETMFSDIPISAAFTQSTSLNWGYKSTPSKDYCRGLKDGVCNWPKGRVLGGTSVLNFLIYTRGHKRDYDEWEKMGNTGWSYKNILKYFKKSENIKIDQLKNSEYHGQNGYLDVENSKHRTGLFNSFIDGGQELGYKQNDPNGKELLGFSLAQATMTNGRRCSASKAFIRPIARRQNLYISLRSWVTKILINPNTKEAYGVEFVKNKIKYTVRAKKEVILSAGSIASPQLLMLSGIGPKEDLTKFGIPVIQDLKVGYNLQDHNSLPGLVFTVNRPITVIDREIQNPIYVMQYLFMGTGPLTLPGGAEGIAFVKTPNSTLPSDYPDIEIVMGAGGLNGDSSRSFHRLLGLTDDFYYSTYKNIIDKHAFGLAPILMRPKSRGRISLKSANPFHWPLMEPNYFSHPDDLNTMIEGIEMSIKLAETKAFRRIGAKFNKNPFYGCEHYEFRSKDYWECCIRSIGTSLQHQVGTCKMGPNTDPDAVVNPELKVYGIKKLRVVDCSIIPVIPASHTNAVAFMIGEKAADMVKMTWR